MPRLLPLNQTMNSENEVPTSPLNPYSLTDIRIPLDPIARSLFAQRLALLIKRIQALALNPGKENSTNDCRFADTLKSNPSSSS